MPLSVFKLHIRKLQNKRGATIRIMWKWSRL